MLIISEQTRNKKCGHRFRHRAKKFSASTQNICVQLDGKRSDGKKNVKINVLVAYDLKYNNTQRIDYTNISQRVSNLIDDVHFISNPTMQNEINELIAQGVTDKEGARLLFGSGYAGKRNAVLYAAIKHGIDYLMFLDDDEYPLAVTSTRNSAIWGGQHVLTTHLKHIGAADMTHGHHCGYISPIPHIDFDHRLTESDFRTFIEAISNDILNWDNIKKVMDHGGVTYADTAVLTSDEPYEVEEVNRAKFISGANLCINLTDPNRVFPFYNPPGARGEDTFLSTLLSQRKVLRVPCYTFHDGFSTYRHIMDGVLPTRMRPINSDDEAVITRFYRACIGWIRYKPLLLYITQRSQYDKRIRDMRDKLSYTLPKVCAYFGKEAFMDIAYELERYHQNVQKHYAQFQQAQETWVDIRDYYTNSKVEMAFTPVPLTMKGDTVDRFTGLSEAGI